MIISKIRTSKVTKVVSCYLALQLIITIVQPNQLWALTSGPSQPEFDSFTPISTSDMVDLSSGNFNYNIPIMDVGGYPLNLAYDSGVTMDQEASWTGLGWNLNVGQINRDVRGIPDDFKGDEMIYETSMKDNVTVGVYAGFDPQVFGIEKPDEIKDTTISFNVGVDLKYNNYQGISFTPSFGLSFSLSESVSVGMDVQTSATEGVTISPSVSAKKNIDNLLRGSGEGSLNAGISYNSNAGLSSFTLSSAVTEEKKTKIKGKEVKRSHTNTIATGSVSFANTTLTPRKRTAFRDYTGTLAVSVGPDVWGLDGEIEVSAMGAVQKIKDKVKPEKAYGYEFTGHAGPNDVLDYNRENDDVISKSTLVLPTAAYTYDLYSVNAQGTSGMFRPFRSQVGQINDETVKDESASFSLGVEIEAATGFHAGLNFTGAPSTSKTGIWNTKALKYFKQNREDVKEAGEKLDYEPVYFKYIGEPRVDKDQQLFEALGGYAPIALEIEGSNSSFNKQANNRFIVKNYEANLPKHELISSDGFTSKFKRESRDVRNQSIQKLSKKEVLKLYTKTYTNERVNENAELHHTAEMKVLNADGSTYVFGETAYNKKKQEVTFTTDSHNYDCATGLVTYQSNENSPNNKSGIDHFFSRTTTPNYAHTYLLSAVLSSDYEDLGGDGPTDDDLGAYTRFEYKQLEDDYKWRIPYSKASFDAGLNTNKADQKANYIYGEKEIKYLKKIVTKTHVAIFELSERKDGRGVSGENGGGNSSASKMYKIDQINLYSKPEAIKAKILDDDDSNDEPINAIKTAHFVYDYSQCRGIENNLGGTLSESELSNEGGKLTLRQVYFTYRDSNMGKYTPYTFNYDGFNPDYNLKSYDIWGNYKPNTDGGCNTNDPITTPEFPFVQQDDRALQDQYTSAWTLTSIDLPSGGRIELEYESDDYQFVQDRPTMQMFKIVGAGTASSTSSPESNQKLYKISGDNDAKYLYVKLPDETSTDFNFKKKYLKGMDEKPVYFRFLLNMTKSGAVSANSNDYDYVTGYFEIDEGIITPFEANNSIYVAIPMKTTDMEGGVSGNKQVNPISKAGWYFGRQYLNRQVYGLNDDFRTENVATIANKVLSSFAAINDIFTGPNGKLRKNEFLCAQRFVPEKSWIRLSTPKNHKLGGGIRVKKLVMKDQWNKMLDQNIPDTNKRYNKEYGQTYAYTLDDGSSSGVAAYEPSRSKENPFVEPFYNKGERLIAPKEISYVEKPFGESFFPAPTVTYSKVTVSNLERDGITQHATGKVVSEFYTSKDFPTKVDYTDIDDPDNFASNQNQFLQNFLKSAVGFPIHIKNEITLSQGFMVHTNDMNGKMRSQKVYPEGQEDPVSSVDYIYSTDLNDETVLNNYLPVINKDGSIKYDRQVGVDYDVVTDFRESYAKSSTVGLKGNIVVMMIGIFPVVVPSSFFTNTNIENVAHTTITTKVIHTTAVLKEKVAMDLGARVSTINEAWDAETGQVILTRTVNEFDDEYYNFNFPAYWAYNSMGQASKNIGITGTLQNSGDYFTIDNADQYFTPGDELLVQYGDNQHQKLWVIDFNSSGNGVLLMNDKGAVINRSTNTIKEPVRFKIIRSGNRNQQMANMASVTMMKNPIKNNQGTYRDLINTSSFIQTENSSVADNLRIVNASAVEYDEFWNCQCESGLEYLPYTSEFLDELEDTAFEDYGFNPYVYNVNGEWRAKRSYAYLTERTDAIAGTSSKANTRREGYYKEFTPYYALLGDGTWEKSGTADDSWTFASEVTQYSPYGMEIENKDALNRYSAAQYGYNFTLPTAVTSNSKYRYMGGDNFEDYRFEGSLEGHFNFLEPVNADGDGGITISEQYSHTGRTSLLVPNNEAAHIVKQLVGEPPVDDDYDNDTVIDSEDNCPYERNRGQYDYDGDGIGDACDDYSYPTITQAQVTKSRRKVWVNHQPEGLRGNKYRYCQGTQSKFIIQGKPNTTVKYGVSALHNESRGWAAFVNGEIVATNEDYREHNSSEDGIEGVSYEIELDATGRAYIQFDLGVRNKKCGSCYTNYAKVQFYLIHNEYKNKLIKGNTPVITIDVIGNHVECHTDYNEPYIDYENYELWRN